MFTRTPEDLEARLQFLRKLARRRDWQQVYDIAYCAASLYPESKEAWELAIQAGYLLPNVEDTQLHNHISAARERTEGWGELDDGDLLRFEAEAIIGRHQLDGGMNDQLEEAQRLINEAQRLYAGDNDRFIYLGVLQGRWYEATGELGRAAEEYSVAGRAWLSAQRRGVPINPYWAYEFTEHSQRLAARLGKYRQVLELGGHIMRASLQRHGSARRAWWAIRRCIPGQWRHVG